MWKGRLTSVARLVLVGAAVVGCSSAGGAGTGQANPAARPATVVTVAKAATGPISQTISYTGTAQAADNVSVSPVGSGRVTKINVEVGSAVKAGDVVAELDKSTLNAQVAQAQAGLDAANAKLAQIKVGARPEAIAAAQANTAAAQAKLDAIKAGPRAETVAQAKANLSAAQAKLAVVQQGPRAETVAQAKANLDLARAKLQQLNDGPTADQVAAAKLQIDQAKNSLAGSQANKDGQCNPKNPGYLCEAAQAQAFAAETAVTVANQNLKTLTNPPTPATIAQTQAAVDAAQQALQLAQAPYTAQDVAQAQAVVEAAQQAYQLAQAPYTAQDVAQAQAAVDAATNQAKLAAQPYTDIDVKTAQAAVDQAKAALDLAQVQLKQADVAAPFDGIVTAKLLSAGALASPSTPIVTLNSPNLQVQFAIDESRITNVKAGQTVNLTTNAYPGKQYPATIASVYPSADPKTHTFTVIAQPKDTSGDVKAGMFLTLDVTVASFDSAVLVPNGAVTQQGTQSIVYTVNNNQAHLVPITLGIANNDHSQIVSGISAGDEVITSNLAGLSEGTQIRVAGAGQTPGAAPAGNGTAPAGNGTAPAGGRGASAQPSGAQNGQPGSNPNGQPQGGAGASTTSGQDGQRPTATPSPAPQG